MASDEGLTWATTWTVWPAGTSTGVGSKVKTQPLGGLAVIATPGVSAVPLLGRRAVCNRDAGDTGRPAVGQAQRQVGGRAGGGIHAQHATRGRHREAVAAG